MLVSRYPGCIHVFLDASSMLTFGIHWCVGSLRSNTDNLTSINFRSNIDDIYTRYIVIYIGLQVLRHIEGETYWAEKSYIQGIVFVMYL